MPRPRVERFAIEEVTRDRNTICCVGTKDSEREDGAEIMVCPHGKSRLVLNASTQANLLDCCTILVTECEASQRYAKSDQ
jgi:hypothetical protein